jgi:hypothetical protein
MNDCPGSQRTRKDEAGKKKKKDGGVPPAEG